MSLIQPEPARIGRYQLVTLLAEGGMARVYLAFSRGPAGFDKLVVVKQIRPELAWDQDFVTMFFDEARIAARLSHRNVVHTYEVVEDNGQYLLVMEYLEGHTLADVLRRVSRENMPLDQHLWILTQVLAGLSYAHELRDYDGTALGLVHRDVSPSNVFVSYTGEVKLLDFGIAKAAGAISATHEGTIKGKLGYSAPEQFLQTAIDGRADIYAVGVMLWEALGRRRRRMADTPAATYQARISGLEPKIREVCPDVPGVLADICDRATAPDPEERYATAAEFQRDLEEYLDQASRPPGRRELAALLERHFHAERTERRSRVQDLLSSAITQTPPPSTTLSFASRSPPGALYDLPISDARPSDAPPPFRSALQVRGARQRPILIAGGLLVLVGAFAAAFSRKENAVMIVEPTAPRMQAAPSAVPVPPPDDTSKKVETATVQLFIRVKPVTATVTLDGARLVSNPFQADVSADKRAHVLRASAPGYVPVEQVITFANDTRLDLVLKPVPGAAGKAARIAEAAAQRAAIENWKPGGGEITRSVPDPSPSEARPPESEPGNETRTAQHAPAPHRREGSVFSMKARVVLAAFLALAPLATSFDAAAGPDAPVADSSAVDEARQRFQKGVQLFHEWSFEAALAEFRKAYQLAPSYRLLYNIAQVHYELHNYVDALKAFRQYLNEGGADVPVDRRTQVEAEIRKLEGRVGYIDVVANVDSGQVAIDDVPVGVLPIKVPILVNPGVRRVSVTKPGFGTTARNVTIAGGDRALVQLELNEAVASRSQHEDAGKKGSGKGEAKNDHPRTAMWVSLAATGAFAASAGVFALLAQDAKRDFEHELSVFPNTKSDIDAARSTMKTKAAITDVLLGATAVAGGFTLYFALSNGGSKEGSAAAKSSVTKIGFTPTLGGVSAVGSF